MPRPKRSKVAPSAPAPRFTKSTKPVALSLPAPPLPKDGFNDLYDISDPEEDVVADVGRVKRATGNGKAAASRGKDHSRRANAGNLDGEDTLSEPGEHVKKKARRSPQCQSEGAEIEEVVLDSSSPIVEVGRRERSTPGIENSSLAIGHFRRRPRQRSILGRAAARARSSSVETNTAEANSLATVGTRNDSILGDRQSQQTSATKKAPRNVRSGSIGLERGTPAQTGSIFDLGNFKRRTRQPSILGTAQKDRQPRPDSEDDEDDFNPEDESTPLNLFKKTNMNSFPSTSPRKRKLSASQVQRSSPPPPSDEELEPGDIIPATASQQPSQRDHQSSVEAPLPSVESRGAEPLSETLAPPLSSSPSPDPPSYRAAQRLRAERVSPRGRRRLRDQTPPLATQDSPMSSPPSLTHSPNFPEAKAGPKSRKRQPPPRSTLSTAQLQAFLPRRRRRGPRDPFDIASSEDEIDVSGLASDEDELTHHTIRVQIPRPSVIPRIARSGRATRKSKASPKTGAKRTYGSRAAPTTSDKENEEVDPDDSLAPLPDDEGANGNLENSQELEKRVGEELKRAARKFEEVDKWELEFEDCTASSSSPRDAR